MAVDKFKFVSPGVFIDEIDESGIQNLPERMGPIVIGRFQKGPSNRPTKVESFKEFVQVFGNPAPGNAKGDVWRTGEMTAPTYAAYAVQAWLRNNSPCTVYRVLGEKRGDATSTGEAGWTTVGYNASIASSKGAFGLFVMPSSSVATVAVTGTLAAVWYVTDGAMALTGTDVLGVTRQGAAVMIRSTSNQYTAKIFQGGGAEANVAKAATFNFDRDSDLFIRKVFNTNPTKTNSDLIRSGDTQEYYWLGETFESNIASGNSNSKLTITGSASDVGTEMMGVILSLDGEDDGIQWGDHRQAARAAQTGWFISQDTRGVTTSSFNPTQNTQKLFKFHALDSGEHANRDYKISILDIKAPTDKFNTYGTFTVVVRDAYDTDNAPTIMERFSGLNLNPQSENYICRVIGDKNYTWNSTNKTLVEHGDYPNASKLIRVDPHPGLKDGIGESLLPFGVFGPTVPVTFQLKSTTDEGDVKSADGSTAVNEYVAGSGSIPYEMLLTGHQSSNLLFNADTGLVTASIEFPTTRLRVSSSEGNLVLGTRAYFGYQSNIKDSRRFDKTNLDLLRGQPADHDPTSATDGTSTYSWVFTLDDIEEGDGNSSHAAWVSGSRAANRSFTAKSGSLATGPYVLTKGYDKFTSPMFGGFDGFDVVEKDPFRNSYISKNSETEQGNYAYYSLKKAVDMISDSEFVEFDVAAMPGITRTTLNNALVDACQDRGDAMAVIDVEGGYLPPHETRTNSDESDNVGDVATTVNNLKDMAINSSYGCVFYPFVKIRDTINNATLYVPPSVVALGTFSSSQRKSAVWFAPAGFTRGGLSEGSAGLPVVGVRQRLTSDERDKLYDANINPIASFPAEGIVIFGQKTLQVTPSALDRINVRRLLIYLKKEISRMASRIIFDQNVQSTWDRFKGQVVPFLEGVQAGLGLTDFKVILDNTTTTADLIDRNIMYAKIYLKPARAIEYIALDFIISRSGASFDD